MRRPCEKTWREILEWAWESGAEEFTHNTLLREGIVHYKGNKRNQTNSATSSLRQMWKAGLLMRPVAGKGRKASIYSPISREEYRQKLMQVLYF